MAIRLQVKGLLRSQLSDLTNYTNEMVENTDPGPNADEMVGVVQNLFAVWEVSVKMGKAMSAEAALRNIVDVGRYEGEETVERQYAKVKHNLRILTALYGPQIASNS